MSATKTTDEQIEVTSAGGVVRITLNRPDMLNPLSIRMAGELNDALAAVADDPAARAVLITGAGRAFSSGADLSGGDVKASDDGKPDVLTGLREVYNPLVVAMRELPKPIVSAVNGPAAGIGCSLAIACDLTVAAASSYFLLAFANIGLTVDGGASAFLAARVGHARASEMALLAERIPAEQALEWGLVNRVVPDSEFDSESEALITRLASGPTSAYAGIKAQLNSQCFPNLEDQLSLEASLQQKQAVSRDFIEGVTAFMERREARFSGE